MRDLRKDKSTAREIIEFAQEQSKQMGLMSAEEIDQVSNNSKRTPGELAAYAEGLADAYHAMVVRFGATVGINDRG